MTVCAIIGKGWSLDSAPWGVLRERAKVWIGLNEAALVMVKEAGPDVFCVGAAIDQAPVLAQIGCDRLEAWVTGGGYSLIGNPFTFGYRGSSERAAAAWRVFSATQDFFRGRHPPVATAAMAVIFAARIGMRQAVCVGMDGLFGIKPPTWALPSSEYPHGQAYARCVSEAAGKPLDRAEGIRYTAIDEDIRQAARWFGVELVAAS